PDQATFSYGFLGTDPGMPDDHQNDSVTASWAGAPPQIIRPGQTFTITEMATSLFVPDNPLRQAGATVVAQGLTIHGLSGVRLPLPATRTGPEGISGSGTENVSVTFTAPSTRNADFPSPVGVIPNKPISYLVIFEYFYGPTSSSLTAFEY